MAPQITCTTCAGTFGPTIYADKNVHICRFCQAREKIENDLKAANLRIDELTQIVKALQDSPASITSPPATTQPPTTQPPTTATNAPTPEAEFREVRNGGRPRAPRKIMPITTCHNRFQILSEPEVDNEDVMLVGDSIVRGQLHEFCARAPRTRKRFCIPGGGVDDVIAAAAEVASKGPANSVYVIHAGTNDVQSTRSEELMEKYRKLINSYKEKSNKIIISGIIPRVAAGNRFLNIATSINRRLANLCREEDIGFVDTWDNFYFDHTLFSQDGVHLSQVGAARFGRLLNEALREYRAKNALAPARLDSQD